MMEAICPVCGCLASATTLIIRLAPRKPGFPAASSSRAVDYDYEDVSALEWVAVHRVPPPGGGQLPLNGLEVDPEAEHEAEAIARYAGQSLRLERTRWGKMPGPDAEQ